MNKLLVALFACCYSALALAASIARPSLPPTTGSQGPGPVTCSTTTRPADTTAYASGDLLANSTTAGSVVAGTCSVAAGLYDVSMFIMVTSSVSITTATFRLHLYTDTPGAVTAGDNGAFKTPRANYGCALDAILTLVFSDGATGRGLPVMAPCRLRSTGTLYYYLEVRSAYTPTSAGTFIPTIVL